MIAFATLFLGLVLGVHEVEFVVEGEIAAVVLRLDGRAVGTKTSPPWVVSCNFGKLLHPHRLEALAVGPEGQILDRADQWINLPRSRAEAGWVLEGEQANQPNRARLVWEHLEFSAAEQVTVKFNNTKIPLADDGSVSLPPYDPEGLHTLEAILRFPDGARYQTEISFGARLGFGAETDLTGVPLVKRGRAMPSKADLAGDLLSGDDVLEVIGVERSPGKVVMVLDRSASAGLRSLASFGSALTTPATRLQEGEQVEFLFPNARRAQSGEDGSRLFSISQPFTAREGSFGWLATRVTAPETDAPRRLTDALAVAAVQAADGSRPRAVVLVLGHEEDDLSAYSVAEVRLFLEELRVPLLVWWTGHTTSVNISEDRRPLQVDTSWGTARDISSVPRFMQAIESLREELDSQIIVWVNGVHLPQTIELSGGASKLSLAGS